MPATSAHRSEHLLLYEPRTEGHHPGWLRFITEDLLSADVRLSLAVDLRPGAKGKIEDHLSGLLSEVKLIPIYDEAGRRHGDGKAGSVAACLRQSGADNVFLCAWDEIASACWRRATLGLLPPGELRGRMGGIYHRPRFLEAPVWSPNRWLKQIGFRRLMRQQWLRQLLLVDEYLAADLQRQWPGSPVFFLPDPCPSGFYGDARVARQKLGVPEARHVFLFYGGGYRRKGLHLAVQALRQLPADSPAFLLCAGQQNPSGETAQFLEELVRQNRARLISRYVTAEEEKLCFLAGDVVLLPYLNHFGTSGVLSRAMAAGKPVIVSDEQLLGRLAREQGLGWLFPSGDVEALRECLQQAARRSPDESARFSAAARAYALRYSRAAYRDTLLKSLGLPVPLRGQGA
jgi:glycosyltransferase involved in cell wall biosynthesis